MVYVAWLQFPSFGLHFLIRLASTRVPLCNRKTLAPYIKSCLTTVLHTFSTWNEPAIFYNRRVYALFHVLHVNLRLFWCSNHVYRCRIRIRYKTNI